MQDLNTPKTDSTQILLDTINRVYDKWVQTVAKAGKRKKFREELNDQKEKFEKRILHNYKPVRIAMLVGLSSELENVNIERKVVIDTVHPAPSRDPIYITRDIVYENAEPTWRIDLRPAIDFRASAFTLTLRPRFKLPLSLSRSSFSNIEGEKEEEFDYRVDFNANLTFQATENFTTALLFRYLYDHTPQRGFENVNNDEYYVEANKRHYIVQYALKYKF